MPTPSDADPSGSSASSRTILPVAAGVDGKGMVPITTFSMNTSDAPTSIYPAIDTFTCVSGGSIDVTSSSVSGVSSRAVSVYDVTAAPGRSASITTTSTSIKGVTVVLSRVAPSTSLAVSVGDVTPMPAAPRLPWLPPDHFPLPTLRTPPPLPVTPPGSVP